MVLEVTEVLEDAEEAHEVSNDEQEFTEEFVVLEEISRGEIISIDSEPNKDDLEIVQFESEKLVLDPAHNV